MDSASPHVVTYDGLPAASGGAHGLRIKDPRIALERTSGFTAACLRADGVAGASLCVWSDAAAAPQLGEAVRDRLGGPRSRQRAYTQWGVPDDALTTALDLVQAAGADATAHGHSAVTLQIETTGALIDPSTDHGWAGISAEAFDAFAVDGYGRILGRSGCRSSIGNRGSALSVWLCFPADDRLTAAAAHVQEHLPFRMSPKHWRLWKPTRRGAGYASSKVDPPV